MPQMYPLNWVMIFILMTFILMTISSFLYFSKIKYTSPTSTKLPKSHLMIKW